MPESNTILHPLFRLAPRFPASNSPSSRARNARTFPDRSASRCPSRSANRCPSNSAHQSTFAKFANSHRTPDVVKITSFSVTDDVDVNDADATNAIFKEAHDDKTNLFFFHREYSSTIYSLMISFNIYSAHILKSRRSFDDVIGVRRLSVFIGSLM